MAERAGEPVPARVVAREVLSEHLVRLRLDAPAWTSSGVPDEWVALRVPGQFQTRYYTVREAGPDGVVLDVVVHASGLVTGWATGDCVGEEAAISAPQTSYALPDDAEWLYLVGDLTALPAIARIRAGRVPSRTMVLVEAPAGTREAYPDAPDGTWVEPPAHGSALAERVRGLELPEGPGYFWMAGESAQMREIRRYLRREVQLPSERVDLMGYWSAARGSRVRAAS